MMIDVVSSRINKVNQWRANMSSQVEFPSTGAKCPVMHGGNTAAEKSVVEWWPKSLNLNLSLIHI